MNYDCTTHPILPFITITTKFLSKYCIKRVFDRDKWLSTFQFYRKTFLRTVDPKQPKNVKFSLWSIIEIFPRGGAWRFRGGAKILRGGAKRSQGRCAPPPPPSKIRPCLEVQQLVVKRGRELQPFTEKNITVITRINASLELTPPSNKRRRDKQIYI
jgi:hypothetical protein